MYILGISAFYHDSAAALIHDGDIVSAVQEERFTRIKHDSSFPINAIKFCLENSKLNISDIDHITYYENSPKNSNYSKYPESLDRQNFANTIHCGAKF